MRSVDHESSSTTSTCGSAPSSRTLSAIASRITSSAGQPRNVGVNSTRTLLAVDAHVLDDAEVDERDDRDLRIRDLGERRPRPARRSPCDARRLAAPHHRHLFPELRAARRCAPRSTGPRPRAPAVTSRAADPRGGRGVRPELVDRVLEARLVAQAVGPHLARGCGGRPPRGPSSPRGRRPLHRRTPSAPRGGSRRPSRTASGARSCAPSRARAARRAARSGTRRARGRTRARPRSCRARAPRARTARAHDRSRSARSTRTRRPPRATARCRSTRSRASRGSARRRRSQAAVVPARSRASFSFAFSE